MGRDAPGSRGGLASGMGVRLLLDRGGGVWGRGDMWANAPAGGVGIPLLFAFGSLLLLLITSMVKYKSLIIIIIITQNSCLHHPPVLLSIGVDETGSAIQTQALFKKKIKHSFSLQKFKI